MKFLTLLLGLVSGPHSIELAVEPPVAGVELRLDGALCGQARPPEWKAICDFGSKLTPHELVAVGRDAEGRDVARDRQWINLPRPPAEAQFLFESHEGRTVARLHWTAVVNTEPVALVTLDGKPVKDDRDGRIPLPDPSPDEVHLLEAELTFELGITARAVATFGGRYGTALATELTAVPFEIAGQPEAEELVGKFRAGENELIVSAVDRAGADLLVVRQGGQEQPLVPGGDSNLRLSTGLGKDGFVTFVAPYLHAVSQGPSGPVAVFPTSDWRPAWEGGRHWARRKIGVATKDRASGLRLADAVAVAGSTASSRGRRRAVILVLDGPGQDTSFYRPDQVRAYLERLAVPLLVWRTAVRGVEVPAGWGEAENLRTVADFKRALFQIEHLLDRQTVVWFEGGHLPDRIVPAPGVTGIRRLAAGSAVE
jgi:hypothetical protein